MRRSPAQVGGLHGHHRHMRLTLCARIFLFDANFNIPIKRIQQIKKPFYRKMF